MRLLEKNERKSKVTGRVEDLKGNVLVEARWVNFTSFDYTLHLLLRSATFVQPKYANMLSNSVVKQAMGEPEPKGAPVLLSEGVPPPAKKS